MRYFRLAQRYCDEVANPMDMVVFRKQKVASKHSKLSSKEFGDEFEEMAQILCYEANKNLLLLLLFIYYSLNIKGSLIRMKEIGIEPYKEV